MKPCQDKARLALFGEADRVAVSDRAYNPMGTNIGPRDIEDHIVI